MTTTNPPMVLPWHVWSGQGFPLVAGCEQRFLSELSDAADVDPVPGMYDRDVLTALMSALRSGTTADGLLQQAPGLEPARLVATYHVVDDLLQQSASAFAALMDDPERVLVEQPRTVTLAHRLMPVPVAQLLEASPLDREATRTSVTGRVASWRKQADRVETQLARLDKPSQEAVRVGRRLFDATADCVWTHPYFLPLRVGEVVPVRMTLLLGDDPAMLQTQHQRVRRS